LILLLLPAVLATQTGDALAAGVQPPRGAWVGAYVKPPTHSRTAVKRAVNGLESRIRTKLDVVHHYYAWKVSFPTWKERWNLRNGRIPMISWSGHDTRAIANGNQDAWIRRRADAVGNLGEPLFIRWLWEPETQGTQLVRSPASYVAAWRRIVRIFRGRGATNASFVWCPTAWAFRDGTARKYWPGARYVDWVCADGYNWYPGRSGSEWVQFRKIFGGAHRFARRVHRPMIVGEVGVQHDPARPLRRARWISSARRALKRTYPRIEAVVYFHAERVYDWRLTTSSSMAALRRMANDRYFNR
jgi:beta-mannanase